MQCVICPLHGHFNLNVSFPMHDLSNGIGTGICDKFFMRFQSRGRFKDDTCNVVEYIMPLKTGPAYCKQSTQ